MKKKIQGLRLREIIIGVILIIGCIVAIGIMNKQARDYSQINWSIGK